MKIFSRLNKMVFLACAGLVIGGCGFFENLFGVSNVNSTQGKFGEGQSVCNNANTKNKDMFGYNRINFKKIGNILGDMSVAQVEKALNVQIYYIDIKRNEKDNICGYVMTVDYSYNNITLTSQEITQLEKALVDNDKYQSYEQGEGDYYRALKFLKHINRFKIPNDKVGLDLLSSLGIYLYEVFNGEIKIKRFLFGKEQSEHRYKVGPFDYTGDTSAWKLEDYFIRPAFIKCEVADTSEECSQQNELLAIKNYAESVLD